MTHRHTKRVRRYPDDEIGITLGDVEYVMPISEANELVGMINAARHAEPLNWAGTAPAGAELREPATDARSIALKAAKEAHDSYMHGLHPLDVDTVVLRTLVVEAVLAAVGPRIRAEERDAEIARLREALTKIVAIEPHAKAEMLNVLARGCVEVARAALEGKDGNHD